MLKECFLLLDNILLSNCKFNQHFQICAFPFLSIFLLTFIFLFIKWPFVLFLPQGSGLHRV